MRQLPLRKLHISICIHTQFYTQARARSRGTACCGCPTPISIGSSTHTSIRSTRDHLWPLTLPNTRTCCGCRTPISSSSSTHTSICGTRDHPWPSNIPHTYMPWMPDTHDSWHMHTHIHMRAHMSTPMHLSGQDAWHTCTCKHSFTRPHTHYHTCAYTPAGLGGHDARRGWAGQSLKPSHI